MNERTKELAKKLNGSADAAIITSETNRFYFTGFNSSDGLLLVTKNGALFFTDSRYTEAAKKAIGEKFVKDDSNIYDCLNRIFEEESIKTVAVECDRITVNDFKCYKEKLPNVTLNADNALSEAIISLREIKTEAEVQCIVKAQCIAEKAFEHILHFIKTGISEKDIALELDFFMLKNGADALSFETIAVSGKNSSMPHGVPSGKIIENGDFITMDYGAVVNGYHSDMTRTVIVGSPTDKQTNVYNTVLKAQKACISVLKSGISGFEADKAARDIISDAGYKNCFGHGTGHGVGVEIHEHPRLSPRTDCLLKTGNIVTIEPGIYIPGEYGVRIEDMALITENGCKVLTNCKKELIVL